MSNVFEPKLTPTLRAYLQGIDLVSLSRISPVRLLSTAIPNIGYIELVNGSDFAQEYDQLYISSFPKRTEREKSDLIVERLNAEDAKQRTGLAPFRVVGLRDGHGRAIGAAHFSVLHLSNHPFSVPYLQYIYVRAQNRRQDMSEVLHTLVLGVAEAEAVKLGRTVPYTFFETEPAGHGDDGVSRAFASQRTQIHARTGSVALVLRQTSDDEIVTAHIQPGLEESDPPVTLVWAIRKSPQLNEAFHASALGKDLISAYYRSMRDEGFPEQNIQLAEIILEERCRGKVFDIVPLSQVTSQHIPPLPPKDHVPVR